MKQQPIVYEKGRPAMPVTRYRDVSEMQRDLWTAPESDGARRLNRVLEFWRRALPLRHPRGVTRFRSIEEANRARVEWEATEVERIRTERARSTSAEP